MSIRFETIEKLTELIKNKEIKPSDVVKDIYAAIEETDPTIKSFLALDKENAIKKAEELAIRSNCKNIFLYTFDFQGKDFYPKFGFKEVYVKRQYPLTGTEHFFVKKLSNEIDKEAGEILEETEWCVERADN